MLSTVAMLPIINEIRFGSFPRDSPTSVDFKDYLATAFQGIPPYGYIFAAELNQKYFRAIRVDSEVSWIISMADIVSFSLNTLFMISCVL